jgi:guanyl-specific ribonuclease Sa
MPEGAGEQKGTFMRRRNKLLRVFVLLLTAVLVLTSFAANAELTAKRIKNRNTATPAVTATVTPAPTKVPAGEPENAEPTATPGPMEEAQQLADYIFEYGELPDNFVTKKEAKEMGWQNGYWYVGDLGDGICIGGDYFGNYDGKLPYVKGRKYYEADCFYHGGPRNEYRIIYSTDGHVWFTGDHYNTFVELYPTKVSIQN